MTTISIDIEKINNVVKQLENKGFEINRISVGNGQRSIIWLFKNSQCENLIKSGMASFQYFGNKSPTKQGVFYQDNCRVVWSESLY